MLPFEELHLKKATESLLNYAETLAASFHGFRNDLLVAAIWFSLKEEQERVKRLEEILKNQSVDNRTTAKVSKALTIGRGQEKPKVSTDKNKKSVNVVAKIVSSKPVAKGAGGSVNNERRKSSDSDDVCIIEIDESEHVAKTPEAKKQNSVKDKCDNNTQMPIVSNIQVTKKISNQVNKIKDNQHAETKKNDSADNEELFDMDCEEIHDEPTSVSKTVQSEAKSSQTSGSLGDTNTADNDITVISDDDEEGHKLKYTNKPKGRDKPKEKERNGVKPNKNAKELKKKSEIVVKKVIKEKNGVEVEEAEEMIIDVDSDDPDASYESKSVSEPYPMALSQNMANKAGDETTEASDLLPQSESLGQIIPDIANENIVMSNTQEFSSVLPQPQILTAESLDINSEISNPNHFPLISQSDVGNNSLLENTQPVRSLNGAFLCPGAEVMDTMLKRKPTYFGQSDIVTEAITNVKREIDSGPADGHNVPAGYTFEPVVQGGPYAGPTFSSQQFLGIPCDSVSLSSQSSGALTYPYSSTDFSSFASRQYGTLPVTGSQAQGAVGSVYLEFQQPAGTDHGVLGQKTTQQSVKHRNQGDTLSPPVKKRLLDFDRKWHEGPSSSKGQERYIAPPAYALKEIPLPFVDTQQKMTETEWQLRFHSYRSISNHVPPAFNPAGLELGQNVIETETVGVSLDDIGYGENSMDKTDHSEEKTKTIRGCYRGRGHGLAGRRGRGRGQRGKVLVKGKVLSVSGRSRGRGRGAVRSRGKSNTSRGSSSSRGRGKRLSISQGSPLQLGPFSFFKRGRVGYRGARARGGRGSRGGRGANSSSRGGATTAVGAEKTSEKYQMDVVKKVARGSGRGRGGRGRGGRGRGGRGRGGRGRGGRGSVVTK